MGLGRTVRSEATWAQARNAYLAGAGAGEVCERFGVGRTALRDRARREGWRRRDQPDSATAEAEGGFGPHEPESEGVDPGRLDPDDLDPGALADAVMIERAWRMAARAIGRGRLREAQGWTRLVIALNAAGETRRAAAIAGAHPHPPYQERLDAALAWVDQARRAAASPPCAHRPDSPDSPDSRQGPDSAGEPHSARRREGLTRSREAAKDEAAQDPGWSAAEGGTSSPALRVDRSPARGDHSSLRGFASSRESSSLSTIAPGEAGPDSADSVWGADGPPLNRAERRRRARLAAQRPRDGP